MTLPRGRLQGRVASATMGQVRSPPARLPWTQPSFPWPQVFVVACPAPGCRGRLGRLVGLPGCFGNRGLPWSACCHPGAANRLPLSPAPGGTWVRAPCQRPFLGPTYGSAREHLLGGSQRCCAVASLWRWPASMLLSPAWGRGRAAPSSQEGGPGCGGLWPREPARAQVRRSDRAGRAGHTHRPFASARMRRERCSFAVEIKTKHLKAYSSVASCGVTVLCNHPLCLVPEHLHHPKRKP